MGVGGGVPAGLLGRPFSRAMAAAVDDGGGGEEPLPKRFESQDTGGTCVIFSPPCNGQNWVGCVPAMKISSLVVGQLGVARSPDAGSTIT